MLSSHSLSWEFSLVEWQIDIAIWTRVTDNTPKASYLIWCCRSSAWVTSRDRIIVCVKWLSWQKFWTSTKKKWKDQASQGDTFKRLIPFLFCCNLVLVCKVTVFYLIACMYVYKSYMLYIQYIVYIELVKVMSALEFFVFSETYYRRR